MSAFMFWLGVYVTGVVAFLIVASSRPELPTPAHNVAPPYVMFIGSLLWPIIFLWAIIGWFKGEVTWHQMWRQM